MGDLSVGNMTKWADYLISAVRYSPDRKYILEMKQHEDMDGEVGQGTIIDRRTVAANIKKGKTYMTVYNAGVNWRIGNQVRTFITDGEFFIRADKNKVNRDNLGALPEI
jgi:hypothetical protein